MSESGPLIVADTSAIINLNATGCAGQLIGALPYRFAVVDVVLGELESGRSRGRMNADLLRTLSGRNLVEIVTLDDDASLHFEELVIGPAAETLDDGEAATIAFAAVRKGMAIIDEKKGTRICAQRYPDLRVVCSVELFAHPAACDALGTALLADALFNALCDGRMRVPAQYIEWVVKTLGANRSERCSSLSYSVRQQGRATK